MEKPKEALRNMYDNLGLCISDEILLESIKRSSLERMRNSEVVYLTYNPFMDFNFVGKGAETYSKNMNDDIKEYIVSNSKIYFNNFSILILYSDISINVNHYKLTTNLNATFDKKNSTYKLNVLYSLE